MNKGNKKIEEIFEQLKDGVQSVFKDENFKHYLKTMSKFHNYSINNSMLIWLQKPNATFVAGFSKWENEFNRHVKKGEKGIRIIAPIYSNKKNDDDGEKEDQHLYGYRCTYVFDISQTEGDELPTNIVKPLSGSIQDFKSFINSLVKIASVPVTFEVINSGAMGYYNINNKQIFVSNTVSQKQQVKTLIHEIAHSLMHNNKNEFSNNTCEIEAESVAYIVCNEYGIDTSEYSFPYIAGWSKDKTLDELCNSLERIRNTSNKLISSLNEQLYYIK